MDYATPGSSMHVTRRDVVEDGISAADKSTRRRL
jgi:hypothetical protein